MKIDRLAGTYAISLFLCLFLLSRCENPLFAPKNAYDGNYEKGMNIFFMGERNSYEKEDFEKNILELREMGVNSLFLVAYYFSKTEFCDSIFATSSTISDSLLDCAVKSAKKHGMNVVLKPHIDLLSGNPRTKISPRNPTIWATQYLSILRRYADISNDNNLNSFVIATELDNLVDQAFFHDIIVEFRKVFKGRIIYASSFDHFLTTNIWSHVDVIGVNAYWNLCSSARCNQSTRIESWNYWLGLVSYFSKLKGKDLIITEVGYCSKEANTINPGDWTIGDRISLEEQAKSYEALLIQANYFPKVKGIYWWQWELNDVGGVDNPDYTPKDKPAEIVIRKYWGS